MCSCNFEEFKTIHFNSLFIKQGSPTTMNGFPLNDNFVISNKTGI